MPVLPTVGVLLVDDDGAAAAQSLSAGEGSKTDDKAALARGKVMVAQGARNAEIW